MNKKTLIAIAIAVLVIAAVIIFGGVWPKKTVEDAEPGNFEKYGPVGLARAEYAIMNEGLPKITDIVIDPLDVHVGDIQTFTVFLEPSSNEITEVTSVTKLDNEVMELPLQKTGESAEEIVFSASWEVYDTHVQTYRTTFTARDSGGNVNSVDMTWTDPCTGLVHGTDSTISSSCSVSAVEGLDTGNISLGTGVTVTLNTGGAFVWTPGYSITIGTGSIAVGAGSTMQQGYLFYADSDGDGTGDGTLTWDSTPSSTGYVRPVDAPVTDCDTGNANIHQNVGGLSSDNDQDGYTDTTSATRCVGASTAVGGRTYYKDSAGSYSWLTDSQKLGTGDCNDANASVINYIVWYVDMDSDGYYPSIAYQCSSPGGGSATSGKTAGDCNDNDYYTHLGTQITRYAGASASCGTYCASEVRTCQSNNTWSGSYTADSCSGIPSTTSGYNTGSVACGTYCSSATATCLSSGWSLPTSCSASTRTRYAALTSACGTYGSTSEGQTCQSNGTWTGTYTLTSAPSASTRSGYTSASVPCGSSCTSQNQTCLSSGSWSGSGIGSCTPDPPSTWYLDADCDGYYPSTVYQCSSPGGCAATSGKTSGDCCDTDANAHPGQTEYFSSARSGCGGYDYNCDYSETKQWQDTGGAFSMCWTDWEPCEGEEGASGWTGGVPACGGSGTHIVLPGACESVYGQCEVVNTYYDTVQYCR